MFASVLTSAASWHEEQPLLTYSVPQAMQNELKEGQLVAIPYGNKLVEGVVWNIFFDARNGLLDEDVELRPIQTILDPVPALLPHQRALAQWVSDYYVTPLAYAAQMMLPPGLVQRSRVVLHVVKEQLDDVEAQTPRLRALIGLLLSEGELDIERLKEMLGSKRAAEVLK